VVRRKERMYSNQMMVRKKYAHAEISHIFVHYMAWATTRDGAAVARKRLRYDFCETETRPTSLLHIQKTKRDYVRFIYACV